MTLFKITSKKLLLHGGKRLDAGIITDESSLVESAMEQFDSVWRGEHCKKCDRKDFCGDPIIK